MTPRREGHHRHGPRLCCMRRWPARCARGPGEGAGAARPQSATHAPRRRCLDTRCAGVARVGSGAEWICEARAWAGGCLAALSSGAKMQARRWAAARCSCPPPMVGGWAVASDRSASFVERW